MKYRENLILSYDEHGEFLMTENRHEKIDLKQLKEVLNRSIRNNTMKKGVKIDNGKTTHYSFKWVNQQEDQKSHTYIISINIKNNLKNKFDNLIEFFDSCCEKTALLKKVNKYRFIAGISASLVLLTMGGAFVDDLVKKSEEAYNSEIDRIKPYTNYVSDNELRELLKNEENDLSGEQVLDVQEQIEEIYNKQM